MPGDFQQLYSCQDSFRFQRGVSRFYHRDLNLRLKDRIQYIEERKEDWRHAAGVTVKIEALTADVRGRAEPRARRGHLGTWGQHGACRMVLADILHTEIQLYTAVMLCMISIPYFTVQLLSCDIKGDISRATGYRLLKPYSRCASPAITPSHEAPSADRRRVHGRGGP